MLKNRPRGSRIDRPVRPTDVLAPLRHEPKAFGDESGMTLQEAPELRIGEEHRLHSSGVLVLHTQNLECLPAIWTDAADEADPDNRCPPQTTKCHRHASQRSLPSRLTEPACRHTVPSAHFRWECQLSGTRSAGTGGGDASTAVANWRSSSASFLFDSGDTVLGPMPQCVRPLRTVRHLSQISAKRRWFSS